MHGIIFTVTILRSPDVIYKQSEFSHTPLSAQEQGENFMKWKCNHGITRCVETQLRNAKLYI